MLRKTKRSLPIHSVALLLSFFIVDRNVRALLTPRTVCRTPILSSTSTQLHFFRRGSNDSKDSNSDTTKEERNHQESNNLSDNYGGSSDSNSKPSGSRVPFFARFGRNKNNINDETNAENGNETHDSKSASSTAVATALEEREENSTTDKQVTTPTAIATAATMTPSRVPQIDDIIVEMTPAEKAKFLRAQAERARLEAERMDAELTLRKISRLEREIEHAKAKDKDIDDLQREMAALQAKMRGEAPKPVINASPTKSSSSPSSTNTKSANKLESYTERTAASSLATKKNDNKQRFSSTVLPLPEKEGEFSVDDLQEFLSNAPGFVRQSMATMVGLGSVPASQLNNTDLAVRFEKLSRYDYSFVEPRLAFTMEEIEEKKQYLAKGRNRNQLPKSFIDAASGNETELALLALEYDVITEVNALEAIQKFADNFDEDEFMVALTNKTIVDNFVDNLYPKCTRKEGKDPTEAQIQKLVNEILPRASFSTTSKPEKVLGGYIVRGVSKAKNGNELIDKIDQQLSRSSLKDKVTVLYTKDFTTFADVMDDNDFFAFADQPPILYVIGADVVREPRRVLFSLTTALGIATTWYLSLYPFLLNPGIAKRVDEQIALADANMSPDMSWLSDLTFPLFVTFIGIQLAHEAAHRVVAQLNGFKITAPTWVPSIITGITSSVTTFKTLPKNKQAMFDFAVAGPLAGMLAAVVAIAVGSQLTLTADPSMFPALPLDILRQSTLGGGIINTILGNGALSIPVGAQGTAAVAGMNIPLHPVAIAGYIGLIVNALCMIPIGTTDGGRIALALFGRDSKLVIGNLFFLSILTIGLLGSDLFLFYFAFCIAFQTNNEVPARNEVDQVDFSRIIVATSAYVIALLSIIPFQ